MKLPAWFLALLLTCSVALAKGKPAMTAEEEARALLGVELNAQMEGERIAPGLSCAYDGMDPIYLDGAYHDDWRSGEFKCRGRTVKALVRAAGEKDGKRNWRIVDTLVLPRHETLIAPRRPHALLLGSTGPCTLDDRTDTYFFVLLRLGRRDRIDGRTGIERAWTFDLERGRIVPLPTGRIVCHRPKPG